MDVDEPNNDGDTPCVICCTAIFDPYNLHTSNGVPHTFCKVCISTWVRNTFAPACPICRNPITRDAHPTLFLVSFGASSSTTTAPGPAPVPAPRASASGFTFGATPAPPVAALRAPASGLFTFAASSSTASSTTAPTAVAAPRPLPARASAQRPLTVRAPAAPADEEQPRPRPRPRAPRIDLRDPTQRLLLNDIKKKQRIQHITAAINSLRERVPHYRARLDEARRLGIIDSFQLDDRLDLIMERTSHNILTRLNVEHLAGQYQRVKNLFADLNDALDQNEDTSELFDENDF